MGRPEPSKPRSSGTRPPGAEVDGAVTPRRYRRPMDDELPRVTARQLARAERTCPRRLALDVAGQQANRPADRQYRILNQVEGDARLAHATLGRPQPEHFPATDDLVPEERRIYDVAARWYVAQFGDQAMVVADEGTDAFETTAPRTGVRLVGPAGLALEDATGGRELRLLSLGNPASEEVLDAPSTRFALLRRARWTMAGPLRVVRADLLVGWAQAVDVDGVAVWDDLRAWFEERVAVVRARADRDTPVAGWECARCRYIAGCKALR